MQTEFSLHVDSVGAGSCFKLAIHAQSWIHRGQKGILWPKQLSSASVKASCLEAQKSHFLQKTPAALMIELGASGLSTQI